MDEEHALTLAAIAALDDLDARAPGLIITGDAETAVPPTDRVAVLESALRDARKWHVIQRRVCSISTRPAMTMAHAERIAAIDAVLGDGHG